MIVNICPSAVDLSWSLSFLNFSLMARSPEISPRNRDTIKKIRDMVTLHILLVILIYYMAYLAFDWV